VADVAVPGLFEQIRLVAYLRWRVFRNDLRKKSKRLDLLAMLWVGFFATVTVVGLSGFLFWATHHSLVTSHFGRLSLLFWIIFLFWQIFPILMAGLGAALEFRKLLRFPLTLRAFYLISLGYGFADFAALASACWLLAIIAGATTAFPRLLLPMLLVVALFVLMNVTLERLVSSWLERLLARRRTREVLFGLFILASISLQFIHPLISHYHGASPSSMLRLVLYISLLPPSLAGNAITAIHTSQLAPFFSAIAALLLYILLLSTLLWIRYAAQYRGEELSESAAPAHTVRRAISTARIAPSLPSLLPPQISAVILKELRYLQRNGFMLISLIVPPMMAILFSSQFGGAHPLVSRRGLSPDIFFPSLIGYVFLIMMTPAFNCFAYEGHGIQTYFTAPIKFRDLFLGKNLVHISVLLFEISLCMLVLSRTIGVPSLPLLVATVAAVAFAAPGQFVFANWCSLSFPRKLEFGSMRGQRAGGVSIWIALGAQVLLGVISSFIFLLGRWTGEPWLPAGAFAALAVATLAGYFASLDTLSQLAQKKKETLIEALSR
jgi:ABC-2 type transport system permease protein